MAQKILTMTTLSPDLRATADCWDAEDANLVQQDKPIGLTPGYRGTYIYPCVLYAMNDGWRLIGPPIANMFGEAKIWYWWLEKH